MLGAVRWLQQFCGFRNLGMFARKPSRRILEESLIQRKLYLLHGFRRLTIPQKAEMRDSSILASPQSPNKVKVLQKTSKNCFSGSFRGVLGNKHHCHPDPIISLGGASACVRFEDPAMTCLVSAATNKGGSGLTPWSARLPCPCCSFCRRCSHSRNVWSSASRNTLAQRPSSCSS